MDIYTIVGLTGVAAYVAAYSALQLGVLDGNGFTYSLANVLAASLVLVSLFEDFNLASAVTQVIWIAVGLGGLALRFLRRSRGGASLVDQRLEVASKAKLKALAAARSKDAIDLRPDRAPHDAPGPNGLKPDTAPLNEPEIHWACCLNHPSTIDLAS